MIDIEIEPGGGVQKIFDLLQRRIWLGPLILLLALLAGLGLGLLIGWGIAPVNWTPNADDVRAIADSYALNNDLPLAKNRLQNVPPAEQIRLFSKVIADSAARNRPFEAERATALMQALGLTPGSTAPTPTPSPVPVLTPSLTSLGPILIGAVVLLGLAIDDVQPAKPLVFIRARPQ